MIERITKRAGAVLAALLGASAPALAQYCPAGSTYFTDNYVAGCTQGSCWASTAFPGSTPITGSYPSTNYACAASSPPAGALENTLYAYDGNGNVSSVTDPLGRITNNSYDALNRLMQVTDPASGLTKYAYNGTDALTQVIDPRNLVTGYAVNGFGETLTLSSPDTGSTSTTYDSAGNVLTRVDARGVTATYTYDALNRVTQVAYSKTGTPTETHVFEYDGGTGGAPYAKGRLTSVTDSAGTTSWSYEAHGRVVSKSQTVGGITRIVTYGYNTSGQLQTLTTPSGQQVGFTYANNRVSGITVNGTPLVTSTLQEPFGAQSSWHWGNGLFSFRDYDNDGRVASWEFRNGVSYLRSNLTYDAAGRVTQITDPANASLQGVYGYDALNRLTSVQKGNPTSNTIQYGYDAVGNRLSEHTDTALTSLAYGTATNRLETMAGDVDIGYLAGATNVSFTYNNANRLVQVVADGVTVGSYSINALGQRVQKVAGGATTQFVYDEAGHLLGEYDGTGNLIQETVWLEDLPIATLRPSGAGSPPPIAVYYIHSDHLGAPRAISRPSDNVFVWRWDNVDAFGRNAPNENPAGAGGFAYNLRFPGQYFDSETGMHYNYFRDYDPSIGRYFESDPIGLKGGLNTYLYVLADPVKRSDRRGLDAYDPNWPPNPSYDFDPQGNLFPGWGLGEDQDMVCTLPGIIGTAANANKCILKCCQIHDLCFQRNRCNMSSWFGNFMWRDRDCQRCNTDARRCIVRAISKGCSACE